jgi:hypothetical protein
MARYLPHHRHQPSVCGIVFASFKGNVSASPPHDARLLPSGGHEISGTVRADAGADALRPVPFYVAQCTTVTRVSEVEIP